MCERDAFRAMFTFKRPLENLDSSQVPGLETALINAHAVSAEVLAILERELK
jgi:chromosome partitioning protein